MTLSELRARAERLGITAEEAKDYGPINTKATWQAAIAIHEQLQREAQQENHDAEMRRICQDASAPVVLPLAFGAAVGTVLLRNISGMLNRK